MHFSAGVTANLPQPGNSDEYKRAGPNGVSASICLDQRQKEKSVLFLFSVIVVSKMMRYSIVFALLFAAAATGYSTGAGEYKGHYYGSKTADLDYLHKQKKIYDLLMYVDQNVLTDTEYFEVGRNYDIAGNMDYYTNKVF